LLQAFRAQAADGDTLGEVIVTVTSQIAAPTVYAASEGATTQEELANRPLPRPAEVLETVPGLVVTQHSGDGNANQYFPARLQPRSWRRISTPCLIRD
jgi:outer membrane receptor for ferrienterochelin and colicin